SGNEDLHRRRRCGYAEGIRWSVRNGSRPARGRSAERPFVPVRESRPKPLEGSGVGWQRAVGVREAAGEGAFPLAHRGGRALRDDAAGRIGDAGEWAGYRRSTAAEELAAAHTGGIKYFCVSACEITGNKFRVNLQSNLLAWRLSILKRA